MLQALFGKLTISAPRETFKNMIGGFYGKGSSNLYARFQLSSFKSEGGV